MKISQANKLNHGTRRKDPVMKLGKKKGRVKAKTVLDRVVNNSAQELILRGLLQ